MTLADRPDLSGLLAKAQGANPRHVGLIMDGNGRWAAACGVDRAAGHRAGLEALRKVLQAAGDFGVPILTAYGFSSENWQRPDSEVSALMDLLVEYLQDYRHEFMDQDCRFLVSGRRFDLPPLIRALVEVTEQETAHCQTHALNLALSYGGQQELTDVMRALARRVAAGELTPDAIDEASIAGELYIPELPDLDLIIRTSGEQRLSGFMLWQSAYSEFLFHPTLWPDFTPALFSACLTEYKGRRRRFGTRHRQGRCHEA